MHTNYLAYIADGAPGASAVNVPALARVNKWVCRIHCHKVMRARVGCSGAVAARLFFFVKGAAFCGARAPLCAALDAALSTPNYTLAKRNKPLKTKPKPNPKPINQTKPNTLQNKVIKLSDAVQKLPRQVTCNVHGVGSNFLAVGRALRAPLPGAPPGRRFTKGAYFIGKAVWGKVRALRRRGRATWRARHARLHSLDAPPF
jgi:hypothetical protein